MPSILNPYTLTVLINYYLLPIKIDNLSVIIPHYNWILFPNCLFHFPYMIKAYHIYPCNIYRTLILVRTYIVFHNTSFYNAPKNLNRIIIFTSNYLIPCWQYPIHVYNVKNLINSHVFFFIF